MAEPARISAADPAPAVIMRPASDLMQPEHLAAMAPSNFSFSRALISKIIEEKWKIGLRQSDLDVEGKGEVVYQIDTPAYSFDFYIKSNGVPPESERTDRIITRRWELAGVLYEGRITEEFLVHTRQEQPKLHEGRAAPGSMIWCRANRSVRVFNATVDALAEGRQPDIVELAKVCYIMRNSGLDANGAFGTRQYLSYGPDHPFRTPYFVQMLSAFIMRDFGFRLAEHIAAGRSSKAVKLAPEIKRFLGLGNSTGVGLVLFANRHPLLINRWISLRERAIVHVAAQAVRPGDAVVGAVQRTLERAVRFKREDRIVYGLFTSSKRVGDDLARTLDLVKEFIASGAVAGEKTQTPWSAIILAVARFADRDSQEVVNSILIDCYPDYVESHLSELTVSETMPLHPHLRVPELHQILRRDYAWALAIDMNAPNARKYIWYKSIEGEEPRRGLREKSQAFDLALDLPTEIQALNAALADAADTTIAEFLLANPRFRAIVARIAGLKDLRYHTVRMNMLAGEFAPVKVMHLFNVAFYGLDKAKDVNDRWLRGIIFHGAPTVDDLVSGNPNADWTFPEEPAIA